MLKEMPANERPNVIAAEIHFYGIGWDKRKSYVTQGA
jgi:hypothetical protein